MRELTRKKTSISFGTALIVSIVAHVMIVAGVLVSVQHARAGATDARSIEDEVTPPPPPPPPEQVLGIDSSDARTMTFIGYEEYEKHLARLSMVEQAEMQVNPNGGPPPSQPPQQPQPPSQPTPPAAAQPSTATPPPPEPTAPEETPTPAPRPQPASTVAPDTASEQPEISGQQQPQPDATVRPVRDSEPIKEPGTEPEPADTSSEDPGTSEEETPAQPADAPKPKPSEAETEPQSDTKDETETPDPPTPAEEVETAEETDSPDQPTPPRPAPQPSEEPNPSPSPSPGEPGETADKEAEASSMVDVPESLWRKGKPLAAQGLDIKTRRPNIPLVTWLSLRPCCSPVVEIDFLSNGKPRQASLLSSSGDRDLDEYIKDALYRWRASGEPLKSLKGEETRRIRLKLLLK